MKMFRVNKKELVDVVIAALVVRNSSVVLNKVVPSFATGTTGQIAGGVLGYLVGVVLKRPTVSNVSLALAGANVIQNIAIEPAINAVAPGASANRLQARAYPRLAEYAAAPRSAKNYSFVYNN